MPPFDTPTIGPSDLISKQKKKKIDRNEFIEIVANVNEVFGGGREG